MFAGRRSVIVVALSLAAVLAVASLAAGKEMAHSGTASVTAASTPTGVYRDVVWYWVSQGTQKSFHVESTSTGTPVQDAFQITYADGNFTLVYQRVADGPVTTQYTLGIAGLTEWNDSSGDGQFGEGAAVAYTGLGPSAFGRFPVVHSSMTMADHVGVNSFLIESNRGDLAINLTIADGFVKLPSGQNLTPMEAKLTLEVNHTMSLPTTRLSLQISLSTDQRVVLENRSWDDLNEFSTDDRALNVTNMAGAAPSSAFFAWSNSASVNGQAGTVVPSGPFQNVSAPGSYDLYLTYPRQAAGSLHLQIVHDPTMGVVSAAYLSSLQPVQGPPLPFQGDAVVYAVSLVSIAVLVGGTVVLMSRRRRSGP